MKRTNLLLIAIVLVGIVVGCKVACEVQKRVVDVGAGVVVTGLQCEAPAEVKADINAFCDKQTHLCDAKAGIIADLACPVLAEFAKTILTPALSNGLPPKWKCNPQASVSKVIDLLTIGCRQLPF